MQQAVTRSIARLASCGHAGDHIELGTERSVPVYGMLRRSRDRESQPGIQTCKSIGDPVHEATITLRERPIPQVKQPALIRVHDMRKRIGVRIGHLHRIDGIIRFVTRLLRSWSSHDPRARCIVVVRRLDLSHTCIPNIVHTMTPHFLQRGYDAKALVAA